MTIEGLCPFCCIDRERVIEETELVIIYKDGFPVSDGHTLIIPRRHFSTIFEADYKEQIALLEALNKAKSFLDKSFKPDGYNIGINHGTAGGQTVPHLHIHVIPRYNSDVDDPRGGVRWAIPHKAKYWE